MSAPITAEELAFEVGSGNFDDERLNWRPATPSLISIFVFEFERQVASGDVLRDAD